MASELSTSFITPFIIDFNSKNTRNKNKHLNVRLLFSSRRILPASCKMRRRSFSKQQKRHQVKKGSPDQQQQQPINLDLVPSGDENSESGSALADSELIDVKHAEEQNLGSVIVPELKKSLVLNGEGGGELSTSQLDNMISMIRNAEKNILLLNQARVQALEDLHKILGEKEALQGEINVLEMRLAETDARIRITAQEKIHVELLEDQLQMLRDELTHRGVSETSELDIYKNQNKFSNEDLAVNNSGIHSLSKELDSLRTENLSLKNDIEALKAELNNVKDTDERVVMLEKEYSSLWSRFRKN